MDILIPTFKRASKAQQVTWAELKDYGAKLVVQDQEAHWYYDSLNTNAIIGMPGSMNNCGIAATRDWMVHSMGRSDDKVLMVDDDLDFAVRRGDDRTKFRPAEHKDLENMLASIEDMLDRHPMVGIGLREGGNRVTSKVVYDTRVIRVLGFRRSYLRQKAIAFMPMEFMSDFHVGLQILRSGASNVVLNDWVSNQRGGSNAPGGCSTYRTFEALEGAAKALAARHPGLVRVGTKQTKTAWGGKERVDVTVYWKQAAKAGKAVPQ